MDLLSSSSSATSPHPFGSNSVSLYDQEKECSRHQQELDKALETLEKEKMELEMRLREQQAETEALRTQKEEERAKAESALCQVGG